MTHLKIARNSLYWSLHTHSRYSFTDALPSVEDIVEQADRLHYPGLGLTDHGNMAGTVRLYKECKKKGIKPFPGTELYVVADRADKKAKRYHLCVVAYTTKGYRNLVKLSTRTHRQFYNKPILDLSDMAELYEAGETEGLALTTGCYFGLVVQTLIESGYQAGKQLVATLAGWFEVYVEIQMHCIERDEVSEQWIANTLYQIATELDLPVVITQDSHYVAKADKVLHDSLKALVAWGPDPDDALFPGDGYHMVDDAWMLEHHGQQIYDAGIAGLRRLLDKHTLAIPEMDEYDYKVPVIYPDPDAELRARCEAVCPNKYRQRMEEELAVISVAGMADYLLMVAEVCQHMREVAMFYQIRGSAAGSLVCYLVNINSKDPMIWGLTFQRFLSKDRTKPPDIDIDVEHDRRKELIGWIGQRFSTVQICNWGTFSLAGEDGSQKGSLRVKYLSRMRKLTGSADWSKASVDDVERLNTLSSLALISNPGVHAAGLVVCSSSAQLEQLFPMQWIASSQTMVSQYDGHDVEDIGGVKLDVLGVKTLSVLRRTIINMGLDPKDGLDFIPFTDRKVFSTMTCGDTDGMFQLEGRTSQRMITQLKPRKIGDVIAAMALFRPGVLDSGETNVYLKRFHRDQALPQRHPVIAKHTDPTMGVLLYQDQVIDILRELGMDSDSLTEFLTAVKASNKKVEQATRTMERYSPIIQAMCTKAGMSSEDVAWLWNAFEAFAQYSFNKAHATIYGITAYQSGWLIVNKPLEFHAALLAVAAGTDKEDEYKSVARRRRIRLLRPDVNISSATYTVDHQANAVRRGLLSVKGIGPKVASEVSAHAPYAGMADFCERVNPRIVSGVRKYLADQDTSIGKLSVLAEAGVLDSIKGK